MCVLQQNAMQNAAKYRVNSMKTQGKMQQNADKNGANHQFKCINFHIVKWLKAC